jgi:phosphohistidine phosphatase
MNLFILRHGLAVEPGAAGFAKDPDRPLTPKGERKLGRIAEALIELEIGFDCILSSPYLRARQTAAIIAEGLDLSKKLELTEHLTPAGSGRKLIDLINHRVPQVQNVLLVGHEPYLSELISLLLSGSRDLAVEMKKGGMCKLTTDTLEYGRCARLEWLVGPKHLCRMA